MSSVNEQSGGGGPTITVIVPAFNAAHYLRHALPPLRDMLESGEILELFVVDDQSTDDTAETAAGFGARVIKMARNGGPGAARNHAAAMARGDIIWMVDADVVVHPGGPALIRSAFKDETLTALFGSYDDAPPADNFASQYKNLTHRFYHQRGKLEASTFWSGCGAVRREAFLRLGGFDVEMFRRPSVEDIELGYRIRAVGGRIHLRPDLLSTHLKDWGLMEVVTTDIFRRALPWSRLLVRQKHLTDDLNVNTSERIKAVLAGLMFLSISLTLMFPFYWYVPLAAFVLVLFANKSFFGFMSRARGVPFALVAVLFHQLYYIYSGVVFSYAVMEESMRPSAGAGGGGGALRPIVSFPSAVKPKAKTSPPLEGDRSARA